MMQVMQVMQEAVGAFWQHVRPRMVGRWTRVLTKERQGSLKIRKGPCSAQGRVSRKDGFCGKYQPHGAGKGFHSRIKRFGGCAAPTTLVL